MKTVAIVSNSAFNIYNFRLNLANFIRERGYEVFFVAPKDKFTQNIEKEGYLIKDIFINPKGNNPIEDKKTIDEFKKIYCRYKPDLILNYTIKPNIYSSLAANSLNIPVINTVTGLGTVFIEENFVTDIVKILYKIAFKKAFKVFFQNSYDKNFFVKNNIVKEEKAIVVPGSGVDTMRFFPRKKSKNLDKFIFLFIGRMIKDKGVMEYIKAAEIIKQKYKNVEFWLLGSLDADNKTLISKKTMYNLIHNGSVTYLGSSFCVEEIIGECDCVVLPSYREGLPKSLLEGASMQKPLIATNVVGCKDVVIDGVNGFLCEAKSADSLAKACENMLLLDKRQRDLMGKRAREIVLERFDEKIVCEKYIKEIEKISPVKLRFKLKSFETFEPHKLKKLNLA